jgi:hypothetical protein
MTTSPRRSTLRIPVLVLTIVFSIVIFFYALSTLAPAIQKEDHVLFPILLYPFAVFASPAIVISQIIVVTIALEDLDWVAHNPLVYTMILSCYYWAYAFALAHIYRSARRRRIDRKAVTFFAIVLALVIFHTFTTSWFLTI